MTGSMKIRDALQVTIRDLPASGTCRFADFSSCITENRFSGIAFFPGKESEDYLLFVKGGLMGALRFDEQGERYGDTAVLLLDPNGTFILYPLDPNATESLAVRCRVYRPEILKTGKEQALPEFGKKAAGIGTLKITLQRHGQPVNGIRVTLRKSGKAFGTDTTFGQGEVSFRVGYGEYEAVLQEPGQNVRTVMLSFRQDQSHHIVAI